MDELCPRRLVGARYEIAEGAVNRDEDAVIVVELEIANEGGIRRPPQGLSDLADESIVPLCRPLANAVLDHSLEIEGVEIFALMTGESPGGSAECLGELRFDSDPGGFWQWKHRRAFVLTFKHQELLAKICKHSRSSRSQGMPIFSIQNAFTKSS